MGMEKFYWDNCDLHHLLCPLAQQAFIPPYSHCEQHAYLIDFV